jgi:hypothetical protein
MAVDKDWEDIINIWTKQKLKCSQCGNFFYEINNLGAWECSQHAVEKPHNYNIKWPCCNKIQRRVPGMASRGCVRADHTTKTVPFEEHHDISFPLPLVDFIGLYRESVVMEYDNKNQDKVTIRRFDWKIADSLGRNDIFPRVAQGVFFSCHERATPGSCANF